MVDTSTLKQVVLGPSPPESSRTPSIEEKADIGKPVWDDGRFAGIDRAALLRRADWRIFPYLCTAYMVVRLDLNNISNAGIMNSETGHSLKQVLHLDAQQWVWAIACFNYPYMFIEPVATIFVKVMSPSTWLGRIMVSWGIVMCCMAAITSYAGLITTRVLLGALEGSFFTSMIYHLSFWYTADELAPRVILLYVANASSGGFSGLFAYAISFANGNLYGWQVLFIIEGLMPFFLGIGMFFILPDFPQTSKWLTPIEQEYFVAHLHRAAPNKNSKTWNGSELVAMFKDPTFWLFSGFWTFYSVGAWGIGTVLPFVVKDMGIAGSAGSNLLQIPPAVTGILMCLISSYLIRTRGISAFPVTLAVVTGVLVSYAVLITVEAPGVRFAAACVVSGAAPTAYACLWPRRVAALRGTTATAIGIGINNAISQFSGILGPQLWRSDYGPRYIKSAQAACALIVADFIIVCLLWFVMEGPIHRFPSIQKRVLAQTQVSEEDREAAARGETVGNDKYNEKRNLAANAA